jgi:GntR family transcriptional regulator/MocR family aminotransferase
MAKRVKSVAAPDFNLDHASSAPLTRQLYERLRQAILSGHLQAGTRLPSIRGMASQLGISRNTVASAYLQLSAEGYTLGRVGHGTRVAPLLSERTYSVPASPPAQQTRSTLPADELSERGRVLLQTPFLPRSLLAWEPGASQAFRVGVPALDEFPQQLWARLTARRARRSFPTLLSDWNPAGYRPLREAITTHLRVARGVRCDPEQVIITAGAQGGLDLAARVLLDPGDIVWIEDPGYLGTKGALLGAGARLVPVPVDQEGLDVAAGKARAPHARLAVVTPSHQSPLGVTMSLARRLALLEWAKEQRAWIVEDDYDSEYRFAGRPLAALQGLDSAQRVLYLGTFSKVLFPTLRLGYLIAPPQLVSALLAARRFIDMHVPLLEQAVVADFINEGHFTRHIRRMRLLYAERRAALIVALERTCAGLLEVVAPEVGMHLIGWLPAGVSDQLAARQAAEQGVQAVPLSLACLEPLRRGGLLLGYAAVNEREIEEGVRRLISANANLFLT